MNAAHFHLLLNHIPVVGMFFALLLLAAAVARRSEELKKAALWALVVVAGFAVPTYLTGEPAEMVIMDLPDVTEAVVDQHQDAAKIALALVSAGGIAALAGLVVWRAKTVPHRFAVALLAWSVAALGVLGWTANLGGKIRHTELRGTSPATPAKPAKEHD